MNSIFTQPVVSGLGAGNAPKEAPAIPQALGRLEDALSALDEGVKLLHDKLTLIRTERPDPEAPPCPEKQGIPATPQVLERINAATNHALSICRSIGYNYRNIEI